MTESLHGILDIHPTLHFGRFEQFPLPEDAKLIFECGDLHAASPATVSRCAIVNVQEPEVASLVDATVNRLQLHHMANWMTESHRAIVTRTVGHILSKALLSPQAPKDSVTPAVVVRLFEELLSSMLVADAGTHADIQNYLNSCIAVALAWAQGSSLPADARSRLSAWIIALFTPKLLVPEGQTLFDLQVDANVPASILVPWFQPSAASCPLPRGMFLPTPSALTAYLTFLVLQRAQHGKDCHSLLLGPAGSGKSFLSEALIRSEAAKVFRLVDLRLSKGVCASKLQRALEQQLARDRVEPDRCSS